jgi:hypothetical protein
MEASSARSCGREPLDIHLHLSLSHPGALTISEHRQVANHGDCYASAWRPALHRVEMSTMASTWTVKTRGSGGLGG